MNEQQFREVYYNPEEPAGFSSKEKLRNRVNNGRRLIPPNDDDRRPGVSYKTTERWLSGQRTYTVHRKPIRKFKRRKTITRGIGYLWQCDLAQLDQLAVYNSGKKYIHIALDCFSRFMYAEATKNKSAVEIAQAMEKIFQRCPAPPQFIQVDFGREYHNQLFQNVLMKYGFSAKSHESFTC